MMMSSDQIKINLPQRVALGVSYQGSAYSGWQRQPDRPTIQGALEQAIQQFIGEPLAVVAAGRTDAGVHAVSQVVHLDSPVIRREFSWVRGVNAFLPADIRVKWAQAVAPEFHARFDAVSRTYAYVLRNHPIDSALHTGRVGWFHPPLCLERMRAAAQYLIGTHDFSSFRSAECQAHSPVRTLHSLSIQQQGSLIIFVLHGDGFLQHMVRNVVGNLVYVGKGKYSPEWLKQLLLQRDRRLAAPTIMADGLYLLHVEYPPSAGLTVQSSTIDRDNALAYIMNV